MAFANSEGGKYGLSAMEGIVGGVFTGTYDLTLRIDVTTIVVVLLLFAATYILKYGAVLQQESDETL